MIVRDQWCPGAESNHRHEDFQSTALPLSYPGEGEADPPLQAATFYTRTQAVSRGEIANTECAKRSVRNCPPYGLSGRNFGQRETLTLSLQLEMSQRRPAYKGSFHRI